MRKEEIVKRLDSFLTLCVSASGENIPDKLSYRDISKVICERYPTQQVEIVRIFLKSTNRKTNNKPYTYPEELPIGTATMISDELHIARTTVDIGYGTLTESVGQTSNENKSELTAEQKKALKQLGYEDE